LTWRGYSWPRPFFFPRLSKDCFFFHSFSLPFSAKTRHLDFPKSVIFTSFSPTLYLEQGVLFFFPRSAEQASLLDFAPFQHIIFFWFFSLGCAFFLPLPTSFFPQFLCVRSFEQILLRSLLPPPTFTLFGFLPVFDFFLFFSSSPRSDIVFFDPPSTGRLEFAIFGFRHPSLLGPPEFNFSDTLPS